MVLGLDPWRRANRSGNTPSNQTTKTWLAASSAAAWPEVPKATGPAPVLLQCHLTKQFPFKLVRDKVPTGDGETLNHLEGLKA